MLSFFRSLLARRAWFHTWLQHDDLHRACTVCGQREERDADGDWMCNGPGAWWVAQSGKRFAHFGQTRSSPVVEQFITSESGHDVFDDEHAMM
jgi:hypothetical protein